MTERKKLMTKPTCIAQARDLLRPGLYEYDRDGDVYEVNNTLVYAKDGHEPRVVLTHEELDKSDWAKIAKERLGWPT